MDVLYSIVAQKKKEAAELKKEGKTWIARKDIKKKELADALKATAEEEEKRKRQERMRLKELEDFLSTKSQTATTKEALEEERSHKKRKTASDTATIVDGEAEEGDPTLVKNEVVRRLRKRGQVVTYFGESDWQRYKRLCESEIAEHGDELAGGQHNVFLRLLEDQGAASLARDDHRFDRTARRTSDPGPYDEDYDDFKHHQDNEASSNAKDGGAGDGTVLTKEAHVRAWIRRMLNEWECELQQRTEEERDCAVGKIKTAQCKQTRKDLRPLMKKLKHGELDVAILDKIHAMVTLCETKEYKKCHDKYIELSIGNAAWPMGVTMVGIHERAGRSKIFTSEIAHVLNDETTRKYIHMFKRLISFCQRKYPQDFSKMVSISTIHI